MEIKQMVNTAQQRKHQSHDCQRNLFQRNPFHKQTCQKHACLKHRAQQQPRRQLWRLKIFAKHNALFLLITILLVNCLLIDQALGVTVEALKAPIKNLKETIFGGWMWVPKIGAAVGGCLMAVYNQSIVPLATGAGVGLGIHFYDLYIKADGALI